MHPKTTLGTQTENQQNVGFCFEHESGHVLVFVENENQPISISYTYIAIMWTIIHESFKSMALSKSMNHLRLATLCNRRGLQALLPSSVEESRLT